MQPYCLEDKDKNESNNANKYNKYRIDKYRIDSKLYDDILKELKGCYKPIILFDDDVDGLSSFLQVYHYIGDGGFTPIKDSLVNEKYLKAIHKDSYDKVIVLDKSAIDENFVNKSRLPILWIDHHPLKVMKSNKVTYLNPKRYVRRTEQDNDAPPVSYLIYQAIIRDKERRIKSSDIVWISIIGCLGDWFIPPYIDEYDFGFEIDHTKLGDVEYLLYDTKFKELIRIFLFLQKGKKRVVRENIKAMLKIKSPQELLEETTENARLIMRRVRRVEHSYNRMLEQAINIIKQSHDKDYNGIKVSPYLGLYVYESSNFDYSLSAELSNELLHIFHDKVIIVCRHKDDEYRCSLRSHKIAISPILFNVLKSVDGYGGGHKKACGACIKEKDFNRFIGLIQSEIEKVMKL